MPRWTRRLAALVVVAVASATALAQDDGASHEWNQHRGNAARSACVDVAPIRSPPVVAWSTELPGRPSGAPVVWQGIAYVATRSALGDVMLSAFRAATGERLAVTAIGRRDRADLAVSRGGVVVVDAGIARCLRFDGSAFTPVWTAPGPWYGQPLVSQGQVFLSNRLSVRVFDAANGREVIPASRCPPSSVPEVGALCLTKGAGSTARVARLFGSGAVLVCGFDGLGSKALEVTTSRVAHSDYAIDVGTYALALNEVSMQALDDAWLVSTPGTFTSRGGTSSCSSYVLTPGGVSSECRIERSAAVVGRRAYGMSDAGAVYVVDAEGSCRFVIRPGYLPAGARIADASAAGDVVYFGNWALETGSDRVLWVLPDANPATPLVPWGDGCALFVDKADKLVGLAEPERIVRQSSSAPAPDVPGDADGVLLADGRFFAGRPEIVAGGGVRVTSAAGASEDVAAGTWALVQQDGKPLPGGEERLVLAAWQEILDRRSAAAWDAVFRKYAEAQLVTEALRALAAAKKDGLSDDRARQLEQMVAGKRDHPNADLQKKRVGVDERALRDGFLADVAAGSRWCAARGRTGAATALLARWTTERPDDPTAAAAALALVPAGFPWAKSATAAARWIAWSVEIVPAGGEFVAPEAPEALAKRSVPWNQDVVLLRTRSVLLVSRSCEPAIVGDCLRHAEGAIRACERVLGPASASASGERMEVRLHANRAEYLAEVTPDGSRADAWTSGYYSPRERVSRFYVPGADETAMTPLSRGMLRVLAHEMTHQWIEQRWEPAGRAGAGTPGYWCVEGVARFIEDQSVEMGRREGRLDDATVTSLDVASQVDGARRLTPLAAFLALSHADFEAIPDAPKIEVTLRNTARIQVVDPRDLFYEQAGSLVFWLVNRCGDGGRAAFVRYLRQRYRGRFEGPAADVLGVKSLEEMERAFRAFLADLRR